MKVKIDQETCIGCGSCSAVCPKLFELNEDGKSCFKDAENPIEAETEESCVKEAADVCPTESIIIEKNKK